MTAQRTRCPIEGCAKPAESRGLCGGHVMQLQQGRKIAPLRLRRAECELADCSGEHYAKGLCRKHYRASRPPTAPAAPGAARGPMRDTRERDASGNKECARCRLWLPEDAFGRQSHTRDGLCVFCKVCKQTRLYGITRREYEALLEAQGHRCAICQGLSADGKALHIDHDHSCCPAWGRSCGKCIRGLLCGGCNKGLGQFRDDIGLLGKAAVYLSMRKAA